MPASTCADIPRATAEIPVDALDSQSLAAAALDWMETAVLAWESARELAPDDVDILVELGRAHLQAGWSNTARENSRAALPLDTAHPAAQALPKAASVAQAMRRGRWGEEGNCRAKVRQPS